MELGQIKIDRTFFIHNFILTGSIFWIISITSNADPLNEKSRLSTAPGEPIIARLRVKNKYLSSKALLPLYNDSPRRLKIITLLSWIIATLKFHAVIPLKKHSNLSIVDANQNIKLEVAMSKRVATLSFEGKTVELPIYSGTLGFDVIDVKDLGGYGTYTLDVGFYSTAACQSSITYIDGNKGVLLYRGFPIDQLAYHSDYMEVCYLLMNGELPNKSQKDSFIASIRNHQSIHNQITTFFNGFRRDAHPMAIMVGVVGALSAFYHEAMDINNPTDRLSAAIRLVAKIPNIAAMCYRYCIGEPFLHPRDDLSYAENFLYMMFAKPHGAKDPDPILARAVDRILTLHADHEQNASTTVVRAAGSTGANPFACISAGIGALWGPAHGGANEACLHMLNVIGDESKIDEYLAKAKDKDDPFRLMGFGHRVYKNYDPRATVMRETAHEVLEAVGRKDEPLFKLAMKLEKIALEDKYFIEKKLYPNVDFYSGITLSALGIPTNMFTVIFAVARTVGWISHWMEMMGDPNHRLTRPRQLYTGSTERDVVPLDKRK